MAEILADQYVKSYGFKVDISGTAAADSTEGAWRSVRHSGLRIEEVAVTTGPDQNQQMTRGICDWGELTLVGAVTAGRKDMLSWYKAMQEKGKDSDCYKDVTVTLLKTDGGDMRTYNFLECFLTSYQLCPLNSDEQDVEAQETVTIQVGHSDNFLTA